MIDLKKAKKLYKELCNLRFTDSAKITSIVEDKLSKLKVPYKKDYINSLHHPLATAVSNGSKVGGFILTVNPFVVSDVILLGKGIVYDSGGYNLKDRDMHEMIFDKTGAMLAIVSAILYNVPAQVIFASNMVSAGSYVAGEIYGFSPHRVLITNTDAEGRLLLADLIKNNGRYKNLLTLATLTGSAVSFTKDRHAALLHTDKEELQIATLKAYNKSEVDLYPANFNEKYNKALETKVIGADFVNADLSGGAGSQTAYMFLRKFQHHEQNLIHVDMAAMMCGKDGNALGWGLSDVYWLLEQLK